MLNRLKLPLLLLVLLLAGTAVAQQQDSPFLISDIKANQVSPGVVDVSLTTTTLRKIPPIATVPVPVAPLMVTGVIPLKQILDIDILGSSLSMDLNGDRRMGGVTVRETEKGLRFNGAVIEAMGVGEDRQEPFRADGAMRRYRLSPDAPEFSVLYYQPPAIGLLLAHRNLRPEVRELPNPHLQLVVFEHSDPVDGPRFLPDPPTFTLTIEGKEPAEKDVLYAWLPGLFQSLKRSPRWIRAYWYTIPLDPNPSVTNHSLQVKVGNAHSALGLYAQINYAPEAGVQMRTNRSVGLIWAPQK